MSTTIKRFVLAAGIVSVLAAVSPAFAQGHGGGGGGGGGGHAGGAHFSGGGGHGGAVAHGAPHFAAVGHSAYGYGGHVGGYGYGGHVGAYGYGGHVGAGGGGGYHGYSTGAYWGGGYWRGGYWPRAYYGLGFAWFLPVLPLAYATYWYGGIPYYYANDVYYTWDPSYSGYVATDPPPVADPNADAGQGQAAPAEGQAPAVSGQVFMYPKNGQSAEQQSTDRRECQQWASSQAGQNPAQGDDYRRAMLACIEGRGYSAE